MSLIHWWPLNGNLKDYGIKNFTLTGNATTNNSGKIGKCYSFNGSNTYLRAEYPNTTKPGVVSIAAWYKANSTASGKSHYILNCYESGGAGLASGDINIKMQVYCNGNYYNTTSVIPDTNWHHWCGTFDGRYIKIYMDGVLKNTYDMGNTYSISYEATTPWMIGANPNSAGNPAGNYTDGVINDVRLYSHALSKKEVKEISKGLVLHYTFEDAYAEGTTNRVNISNPSSTCYNGVTSTYGWGSNTNMQKTMGTFHGKYGMKVSSINAGSYTYPYVFFDNLNPYSTTENTYSTFSFDYYATSQTILVPYSYYSGVSIKSKLNGVDMGGATISGIKLNTWNHIEITYQRTTNDYQGNGCGYIRIGSTSHTSTTSDYWIFANLQSEYKDHATPYVNGTRQPGLIYDSSGYGYNGTPTGAIEIISGNVSGNHVINFPATSCYIKLPAFCMSGFANSYTFSWWSKITDMSGRMAWGFGDGNRLNLYPSGAFCWNTGDGGNNKFQNNGTAVSFTPYNNAWHLYTITGDGTTTKLYIDGELKGNAMTYKALTGSQIYISGWDTGTSYKWAGKIADFKIYATALSASDILAEYSRKASIDRNGNLFIGEFNEYQSLAPLELNTTNFTMSSASFSDNNTTITVNGHWAGFQYANANFKYQKYYHLSFDAMYVSGTFLNILGHMANFSPVYWYIDGKKGSVGWDEVPDAVVAEEQVMLDGKWHHFDIYTRYANQNDNYGVWVQVNRTNTSGSAICKFTNLTMEEISSIEYKKAQFPTKRGTVEGLNIIEGFDNTKIGHNATIMANELHEL